MLALKYMIYVVRFIIIPWLIVGQFRWTYLWHTIKLMGSYWFGCAAAILVRCLHVHLLQVPLVASLPKKTHVQKILFYLPTKTLSLCANPHSNLHAHAKHPSREKLIYIVLPEHSYAPEHAKQCSNSFICYSFCHQVIHIQCIYRSKMQAVIAWHA